MKRRNSLRSKFVVPIVSLSLVLLIVPIFILGQKQLRDTSNIAMWQMSDALHLVADYVSEPLISGDEEEANNVLLKVNNVGFVTALVVYKSSGELFASYGDKQALLVLSQIEPSGEMIIQYDNWLAISMPVMKNDVVYGTMVTYIDKTVYKMAYRRSISLFVFLFLVMAVLSTIITLIFERRFLKPISQLAQNFKNISQTTSFIETPELIRFDNRMSEEIALLVSGFNDMITKLVVREKKQHEAEAEIRDMNDRLELEVLSRTAELSKTNEKLVESFENERNILENLPYGIILIDYEANIVEANDFARKRLGFVDDAPKTVADICKEAVCLEDVSQCPLLDVKDDLLKPKSQQAYFRDKEGNDIPVLKTVIPIVYNERKVIMEAFVDITDLRETQLELVKAKERAEESDRLKSAFLANMSHEIRTPLNAIIGFTNILVSEDLEEEIKADYRVIVEENTDNLLNLIEDILDLSKLESGTLSMNPQIVNMMNFVSDISKNGKMLIDRMEKTQVEFITKIDSTIVQNYIFDSSRIKQVILNLINNATKFTDSGAITFGVNHSSERELLFYVKDTGPGIVELDNEKIFNRFYKSASSGDKLYAGTGLGLAICKNIIELNHGEIWYETEVGKGTTFYFSVPV